MKIFRKLGKPIVYISVLKALALEPVFEDDFTDSLNEVAGYVEMVKHEAGKPKEISVYISTLPSEARNKIEKYVERLASPRDMDIQTRWENMSGYIEIYEEIAEQYGIPKKIFLAVPIIENEGKKKGTSKKGARGPWQIMPDTAKSMGWEHADILDPLKSPYIAAQYLKELYEYFSSWEMALAGYNYGPTRIKENNIKDFWEDHEKFPFETQETVPRVLAAAKILENPEQYKVNLRKEGFYSIHKR